MAGPDDKPEDGPQPLQSNYVELLKIYGLANDAQLNQAVVNSQNFWQAFWRQTLPTIDANRLPLSQGESREELNRAIQAFTDYLNRPTQAGLTNDQSQRIAATNQRLFELLTEKKLPLQNGEIAKFPERAQFIDFIAHVASPAGYSPGYATTSVAAINAIDNMVNGMATEADRAAIDVAPQEDKPRGMLMWLHQEAAKGAAVGQSLLDNLRQGTTYQQAANEVAKDLAIAYRAELYEYLKKSEADHPHLAKHFKKMADSLDKMLGDGTEDPTDEQTKLRELIAQSASGEKPIAQHISELQQKLILALHTELEKRRIKGTDVSIMLADLKQVEQKLAAEAQTGPTATAADIPEPVPAPVQTASRQGTTEDPERRRIIELHKDIFDKYQTIIDDKNRPGVKPDWKQAIKLSNPPLLSVAEAALAMGTNVLHHIAQKNIDPNSADLDKLAEATESMISIATDLLTKNPITQGIVDANKELVSDERRAALLKLVGAAAGSDEEKYINATFQTLNEGLRQIEAQPSKEQILKAAIGDTQGKPTIVLLGRKTCGTCNEQAAILADLQKQYGEHVHIKPVYEVDANGEPTRDKVTFDALAESKDGRVITPQLLFVGADGTLKGQRIGLHRLGTATPDNPPLRGLIKDHLGLELPSRTQLERAAEAALADAHPAAAPAQTPSLVVAAEKHRIGDYIAAQIPNEQDRDKLAPLVAANGKPEWARGQRYIPDSVVQDTDKGKKIGARLLEAADKKILQDVGGLPIFASEVSDWVRKAVTRQAQDIRTALGVDLATIVAGNSLAGLTPRWDIGQSDDRLSQQASNAAGAATAIARNMVAAANTDPELRAALANPESPYAKGVQAAIDLSDHFSGAFEGNQTLTAAHLLERQKVALDALDSAVKAAGANDKARAEQAVALAKQDILRGIQATALEAFEKIRGERNADIDEASRLSREIGAQEAIIKPLESQERAKAAQSAGPLNVEDAEKLSAARAEHGRLSGLRDSVHQRLDSIKAEFEAAWATFRKAETEVTRVDLQRAVQQTVELWDKAGENPAQTGAHQESANQLAGQIRRALDTNLEYRDIQAIFDRTDHTPANKANRVAMLEAIGRAVSDAPQITTNPKAFHERTDNIIATLSTVMAGLENRNQAAAQPTGPRVVFENISGGSRMGLRVGDKKQIWFMDHTLREGWQLTPEAKHALGGPTLSANDKRLDAPVLSKDEIQAVRDESEKIKAGLKGEDPETKKQIAFHEALIGATNAALVRLNAASQVAVAERPVEGQVGGPTTAAEVNRVPSENIEVVGFEFIRSSDGNTLSILARDEPLEIVKYSKQNGWELTPLGKHAFGYTNLSDKEKRQLPEGSPVFNKVGLEAILDKATRVAKQVDGNLKGALEKISLEATHSLERINETARHAEYVADSQRRAADDARREAASRAAASADEERRMAHIRRRAEEEGRRQQESEAVRARPRAEAQGVETGQARTRPEGPETVRVPDEQAATLRRELEAEKRATAEAVSREQAAEAKAREAAARERAAEDRARAAEDRARAAEARERAALAKAQDAERALQRRSNVAAPAATATASDRVDLSGLSAGTKRALEQVMKSHMAFTDSKKGTDGGKRRVEQGQFVTTKAEDAIWRATKDKLDAAMQDGAVTEAEAKAIIQAYDQEIAKQRKPKQGGIRSTSQRDVMPEGGKGRASEMRQEVLEAARQLGVSGAGPARRADASETAAPSAATPRRADIPGQDQNSVG